MTSAGGLRRCSCPCPAPLPTESSWPSFPIGTWSVDARFSPQHYPNIQQQPVLNSTSLGKSYGSNDSGFFSTSPVSTNSDSSNSTHYNPSPIIEKGYFPQSCDVITDTLNQLTLRCQRTSVPSTQPQPEHVSESSLVPSRYSRWAGIATELESWEKRLSTGWSNGQIPRSQVSSFVEFLKRLRLVVRRKSEEGLDLCAFCRNNGEPFDVYISHKVRNSSGQVTCPILRLLSCPLCKSTGDQAHTIKYCPYRKKVKEMDTF